MTTGNEVFLDVGACFGQVSSQAPFLSTSSVWFRSLTSPQDLRKLVADGVPSENTVGLDIDGALMDLGYDLFKDKHKLETTFLTHNVFDPSVDWDWLSGKVDIIHASAFFHLFTYDKHVEIAKLFVKLLHPRAGSMVIGRHFGSLKPGVYPSVQVGSQAYRHDIGSFQELWTSVGEMTGTEWKVTGTMDLVGLEGMGTAKEKPHWWDENGRRQLFTVMRL